MGGGVAWFWDSHWGAVLQRLIYNTHNSNKDTKLLTKRSTLCILQTKKILIFSELKECPQIPLLRSLVRTLLRHLKKIWFSLEGSIGNIKIRAPSSALWIDPKVVVIFPDRANWHSNICVHSLFKKLLQVQQVGQGYN